MTIDNSAYTGIFAAVNNISKTTAVNNDLNNDGKMSFDEYGVNKDLFNSLDANGDGSLTVSEISKAITSKMEEYEDKKDASAQKEINSQENESFAQMLQTIKEEKSSFENNFDSFDKNTFSDNLQDENTLNTLLSSNEASTNLNKIFLTTLGTSSQASPFTM